MRADRLGPIMGSFEAVLGRGSGVGRRWRGWDRRCTGPAEVLNDWIRLWMAVDAGVLLGAIVLALAPGELLHLMRRRSSGEEACRAFADAVSRGDLEAAEDMATLAFARNVRGGSAEESAGVRGVGIGAAGAWPR